jgi:hypothetical protein
MENTNNMGNVAEDTTQQEKLVKAYREKMLELLQLLEENDAALNKFADLYREDFGALLKKSVRVEEVRVVSNEKCTDTWVDLRYKNRFYILQEIFTMLKNYLKIEGGKNV